MPTLTSFDFNSLCVLGHLLVRDNFGLLHLCLLFLRKFMYKIVFKFGVLRQGGSAQVDKLFSFLNIEINVDLSLKRYAPIFSYLTNNV